jgi:hypothetical protein
MIRGKNLSPYQDPDQGVQKALDPGSATTIGKVKKNFIPTKKNSSNHKIVSKLSEIWICDPG